MSVYNFSMHLQFHVPSLFLFLHFNGYEGGLRNSPSADATPLLVLGCSLRLYSCQYGAQEVICCSGKLRVTLEWA